MSCVAEHYAKHLAPVYVWMAGGSAAALQAGADEIEALDLPLARAAVGVDLGAGFGMHSISLARRGARVTAIDTSAELLRTLEDLGAGLPIKAIHDDLLTFQGHITEPLVGDQRFIPVRSDDTRILTCFLEYEADAVLVHDILHQRTPQGWQTRVSHYRKLRLAPEHLSAVLVSHGFSVRRDAAARGMVRLVAQRR